MYDIFNPKDLSDDELQERIQKARHFAGLHIDAGHNSLVDSIELTLAVMEEEQEFRTLKKREDYQKEMKQNAKKQRRRPNLSEKPEKEEKPKSETITLGHISGVDD